MRVKDIAGAIEEFAPVNLQESYDNAGLLVGESEMEISKVLLCLDVTPAVIDEAIEMSAGMIVSHHPLIFKGLRRLTSGGPVEKAVVSAIKNDIAVYAAHTNIDFVWGGVNSRIADKLGLTGREILSPVRGKLRKLVVFVPHSHADGVRNAIFESGAGHIGEYDQCSFNIQGEGSFRGSENSDPFVGKAGETHFGKEVRIETILPEFIENRVVSSMKEAHPYEEVAYDIYPITNSWDRVGEGLIGNLEKESDPAEFLARLKDLFRSGVIRHTLSGMKKIRRVALCGGSGSSLFAVARSRGADIYVSADFKYHDFYSGDEKTMIADIGHFESEQYTVEIFYEILKKKFPNFAVHFSKINTNPIQYF